MQMDTDVGAVKPWVPGVPEQSIHYLAIAWLWRTVSLDLKSRIKEESYLD